MIRVGIIGFHQLQCRYDLSHRNCALRTNVYLFTRNNGQLIGPWKIGTNRRLPITDQIKGPGVTEIGTLKDGHW